MISQSSFLQALGWAVLNSLWQMALLWIVYQSITGLFKSLRPSIKSSLAAGLLIAGFGWFAYTFLVIFFTNSPADAAVAGSFITATRNEELNSWLQKTLPLASLAYLLLLILPVLYFIRNYRYVQTIRQYSHGKAAVEWKLFVQRVASQLGIKRKIHIWVSELVNSPVTIGYLKPAILLPMAAVNNLTPQQLEAVLLHELSHIRRYDYLINLIINCIQTVLYFNPFVKAFVKIVEREREKSCDEMVMQFEYDAHQYASALLMLEKSSHLSKPLAVAAAGRKNDLLHRVEIIMGVHKKTFFSFNKLAGLLAGLLCIIALNALLIMSKPAGGVKAVNFTALASPFYFFEGNDEPVLATAGETSPSFIINQPKDVAQKNTRTKGATNAPESIPPGSAYPGYTFVNFTEPAEPVAELDEADEAQVKQAIDLSKKIIEEAQWKQAEKALADAFSEQEKQLLKKEYIKASHNIDWKQWENKLQQAYNQIDWDKINLQLETAITNIKLDSIQTVYDIAISNIDKARSELISNNLKGIPDSDISVKELEKKETELRKLSGELRAIRSKKIVRL